MFVVVDKVHAYNGSTTIEVGDSWEGEVGLGG